MSKFDTYKNIIFSTDQLKQQLVNTMSALNYKVGGFDEAYEKLFFKVEDNELQRILAPFLRKIAIEKLKTHDSNLCKHFRNTYETAETRTKRLQFLREETAENKELREKSETAEKKALRKTIANNPTQEAYLARQSANGVMGTEVDGAALAEALNINFLSTLAQADGKPIVLTDHQGNIVESVETLVCHKATPCTEDSVHLYNVDQNHFFVFEDYYSTIADGNCLYNGFAQHIQQFMRFERLNEEEQQAIISSEQQPKPAALIKEFTIYKNQLEIYQKIKDIQPLPLNELIKLASQNMHESTLTKEETVLCQDAMTAPSQPAMPPTKKTKTVRFAEILTTTKPETSLPTDNELISKASDNGLLSMMLNYQTACTPILLGIAIAVLTLSALLTCSASLAVGISAALTVGLCTTGLSFFSMPTKDNDDKGKEIVNSYEI